MTVDSACVAATFMMQMDNAVNVVEMKYPPADKIKVLWIFDHSRHSDGR